MPYERTPIQRRGRQPSAAPVILPGQAHAATTAAVARLSTTRPPRYRNGEYWPTRHTISPITARPAKEGTSSTDFQTRLARDATMLGHTIASAAPISKPAALVSVPS